MFRSLRTAIVWTLALTLLCAAPGCGGCRPEDPVAKKKREDEEKKKKKKEQEKEKPKPNFDFTNITTYPSDMSDKSSTINNVKPGHWVSAHQAVRANNFDFQSDMLSQLVDRDGKPMDVERTPFQLTLSRPAPLPKGQLKQFEVVTPMFRPPVADDSSPGGRSVFLKNTLRELRGGQTAEAAGEGLNTLLSHQFYFVTLARNPDAYAYLNRTASVLPPGGESDVARRHYRLVLPSLALHTPLPSHPLTWTSVAVVLWDGVLPGRLSPDQQQAMLDWLHWGGQLIISGPASLDDLKGSFLDPHLPADKVRVVEYTSADLDELNSHWSVASSRKKSAQRLTLTKNTPLVGVELKRRPEGELLPHTGGLAIERRVGAGRIVVTALPLDDSRVASWKSFDNFLNGCLLRRPPREFFKDPSAFDADFRWREFASVSRDDPRLVSNMRYFARDVGHADAREEARLYEQLAPAPAASRARPSFTMPSESRERPNVDDSKVPLDDWHFGGHSVVPDAGVAGWNDFSGVSTEARRSLREAAGITVPPADFVWRALWIYLVVLVPVNWTVFRLLGRVEWAWIAAPVIAIVGAVAVVRSAQLDIGFVRSRTELGVLELQGDYPRGHLTRYTALYTSLSTAYSLTFDDLSALALPFSVEPNYRRRPGETPRSVVFRRDNQVRLSNFQIDSNSTGMLHCEQMLSAGGALSLSGDDDDGWRLRNGTQLSLHGVAVLRRTEDGRLEAAWLGELPLGASVALRFRPRDDASPFLDDWDASPVTGRQRDSKGEVNLSGVLSLATEKLRLLPGDFRLISYCGDDAPALRNVTISPKVAQTLGRTLVLCHLRRGPLPAARSDENARVDFEDDPPEEGEPQPNVGPQLEFDLGSDSPAAAKKVK